MAEKPDQIVIRCEKCKRECNLSTLHRYRGICPSCSHASWHIQATYLARQDTSDGTSLTLNALGLNLISSTGISIGSPVPGEKRPVNGIDIHDVPSEVLADIASPDVSPLVKLQAFVQRKQNDQFQQHRESMQQHGAECVQCGMLFVLNDKKPWTIVGTCSKVCCAASLGSTDYALVEDQVMERAGQREGHLKLRHREHQVIQVRCSACGHQFEMPRMYDGVYRKCPACNQKVLVQVPLKFPSSS